MHYNLVANKECWCLLTGRYRVALAMHHRVHWFIHLWAHSPSKGYCFCTNVTCVPFFRMMHSL